MNSKTNIFITLLGLIALGWGVWSFISPDDEDVAEVTENGARWHKTGLRDSGDKRGRSEKKVKNVRKSRETRVDERQGVLEKSREPIVLDDADESEFTELQKNILQELQAALDDNNLSAVRRAIARFRNPKSKGGLEGDVPKVMRRHAISALGWFGSSAAADMVEFMADVDPEVEQDAFSKFELALDDWDMGDRERSVILQTALKAISDEDQINALLMHLNNMRNSVKAETIVGIANTGTSVAQAMMQDQVGYYTDADVESVADVTTWKANNADDPSDEEFYGAQKAD